MANIPRLLVKLHPQIALAAASEGRAGLRPLFQAPPAAAKLALAGDTATWFMAEIDAGGPNPWDMAHSQVAGALGIDESAVLFAEPDWPQSYPTQNETNTGGSAFALKPVECTFADQYKDSRVPGPGFAWHLRDEFSQLASARANVTFSDPGRTRIAHIDTGYDPEHSARPARILHDLERNYVNEDNSPNNAADPNRRFLFDQSGHGTGTSGILAGRAVPQNNNQPIGGAPDADYLPLRIANSVILFFSSAFVQALQYAIEQECDVVSMSMGGLPSRIWNEIIGKAYEAGICVVAASGDCFGGVPTHNTVYPARYHRVISACGVMANGAPYYDLPRSILEGSWGPDSIMTTALSAYTPNTPWAKFGCKEVVDMTGAGTSSATPQIAAAAALWYEKNKSVLPRDWRRVEAVRYALFSSALNTDRKHLGNGMLKANDALRVAPKLTLPKTAMDSDSFPLFRVLTGLGISEPSTREQMLNLELMQRHLMNPDLQTAVEDPAAVPADIPKDALRRLADAVIADPLASHTLRRTVASRYPLLFGSSVPVSSTADLAPPRAIPGDNPDAAIPQPSARRLRTYAIDPSFSTRLATNALNQGLLEVAWEALQPGPAGEYIEVTDVDEDGTVYRPAELDDPRLVAQDGYPPSEGNPQFHQQMVYAVAMTTISHFEKAMGRRVLWRPAPDPQHPADDSGFTQRLKIRPHAFRLENAFYVPDAIELRLGYFRAAPNDPGDHVPGSTVFTCLSHDIVAHETTHAILDGMHRQFQAPTNPDVLAFHEAFADIVALMQHFTVREVLEHEVARSAGDLEAENILGALAVQFGRSTGGRGALRDAIGTLDKDGVWRRQQPDPTAYAKTIAPHARGALLVAAVFDAFLAVYKTRVADLLRLYTGGTGILTPGAAIHPDLVGRLTLEASACATHVLRICVRALDYVPPVDITFGEYLRGIVTADTDIVPQDVYGYRVAFVEAFRRRGIYPRDLETLSVDTLMWQGIDIKEPGKRYQKIIEQLKQFAADSLYVEDRRMTFERTRQERRTLHTQIVKLLQEDPQAAKPLGIDLSLPFAVEELRWALRTEDTGRPRPQAIVSILQQRPLSVSEKRDPLRFYGGSTLIVDLKTPELKYAIRKRIDNQERAQRTADFLSQALSNPLTSMLVDSDAPNRFTALHALGGLQDN